jgi:ABC-type transporter Mla subunit MlaD
MVMTIAEEMKKLTESIMVSSDVRLKSVGELVSNTHKTLKGFSTDRKKMAAQQTRDLANFMNGLSKNVQGLLKSARDMVEQFRKDNTQMSNEQAKRLAAYINDLVAGVGTMLDRFQKDHKHTSKELRDKLTGEINQIQKDVERILKDASRFVGEFGDGMAQARKAWASMSAALNRARKAGFAAPDAGGGKKVTTARHTVHKVSSRKKTSTTKNKGNRQKAGADV